MCEELPGHSWPVTVDVDILRILQTARQFQHGVGIIVEADGVALAARAAGVSLIHRLADPHGRHRTLLVCSHGLPRRQQRTNMADAGDVAGRRH